MPKIRDAKEVFIVTFHRPEVPPSEWGDEAFAEHRSAIDWLNNQGFVSSSEDRMNFASPANPAIRARVEAVPLVMPLVVGFLQQHEMCITKTPGVAEYHIWWPKARGHEGYYTPDRLDAMQTGKAIAAHRASRNQT